MGSRGWSPGVLGEGPGPLEFWHLDLWEHSEPDHFWPFHNLGSVTLSLGRFGVALYSLSLLFSVLSLLRKLLNLWACGEWAPLSSKVGIGGADGQPTCSDGPASRTTTPKPAWRLLQYLKKKSQLLLRFLLSTNPYRNPPVCQALTFQCWAAPSAASLGDKASLSRGH